MHFAKLVRVLLTSLLLTAPASAQALRMRVSVKIVLDKDGNRPTAGYLNADVHGRAAFRLPGGE